MGQQVNFYATPNDLKAAEERIRQCGDYLVLHARSPQSKPRIVPSVDFEENGKKWLFYYLVKPDDLASVQTREVAKQDYWTIDDLRSPVVEFTSSFFDGAKMRPGRVYFQDRYYADNGQLVTKPESYVKWAKSILVAVKKELQRDTALDAYIGPDALNWVKQQGGTLLKAHQ